MNERNEMTHPLPDAPQGVDLLTDPEIVSDIAYARQGQEYFNRRLAELGTDDLQRPSLLPGWTRAHVVAHIGYNARALTRLVTWGETGIENSMYESAESRANEIDHGATLSEPALRRLSEHEAVQLDTAWRNLPDDRWTYQVKNAQGRAIPISETVWMRSRELWLHTIDLDSGASASDIPSLVLRRILKDVLNTWATRDGHVVRALESDTHDEFQPLKTNGKDLVANAEDLTVVGTLPELTMWAIGRSRQGVMEADSAGREISAAPEAHRWI